LQDVTTFDGQPAGAPLSEIALSCGMSDQSNFTRSFRRIVGETPSSWRRTRCGAIEERVTDLAYAPADQALALRSQRNEAIERAAIQRPAQQDRLRRPARLHELRLVASALKLPMRR
jgi:hypothetical protein